MTLEKSQAPGRCKARRKSHPAKSEQRPATGAGRKDGVLNYTGGSPSFLIPPFLHTETFPHYNFEQSPPVSSSGSELNHATASIP